MESILQHAADEETATALLSIVVAPAMEVIRARLWSEADNRTRGEANLEESRGGQLLKGGHAPSRKSSLLVTCPAGFLVRGHVAYDSYKDSM